MTSAPPSPSFPTLHDTSTSLRHQLHRKPGGMGAPEDLSSTAAGSSGVGHQGAATTAVATTPQAGLGCLLDVFFRGDWTTIGYSLHVTGAPAKGVTICKCVCVFLAWSTQSRLHTDRPCLPIPSPAPNLKVTAVVWVTPHRHECLPCSGRVLGLRSFLLAHWCTTKGGLLFFIPRRN